MGTPIVLVPGFWLGGWAWDEVVQHLTAAGHHAVPVTLPGLEPDCPDRGAITLADQVTAIAEVVRQESTRSGSCVVLAVHSGAGFPGFAATDLVADKLAHVAYVDTGPGVGAMDPDRQGAEFPLPGFNDLGEKLDGVSEAKLAEFRQRAVPQPTGPMREAWSFSPDSEVQAARRSIPSTLICTAFTAAEYRDAVADGMEFVAGVSELHDVRWVELPTSHWPMWSKPEDLAGILGTMADEAPPKAPRVETASSG